ncbi:VOC family protein [Paludisphaera mucosa]|uniref:VOC family protein n=1 Tax=Paludisphaera mucosa TaxID=3030827 RepID=A0ABT6F3T6_9BACT|nr:VOC family protein [Paludisphaera mucosa]MDG3002225.1 VOC family protein [Paludisphaera mucosa]
MKLEVEAIHHVGLVVKDRAVAERFYVDALGLERVPSRPSWLRLNGAIAIHLIPLASGEDEPQHHRFRHVALQVADLRATLRLLLNEGIRVSQFDFDGRERDVAAPDDPLDFGVGSLFVRDPDGNTIEFLQLGHGLFAGRSVGL